MIKKIISGGQTGADIAALDVAIEMGIPHGGWIPKGRLTEDGRLSDEYKLQEMPSDSYAKRTERIVVDSHGTLIVSHGDLNGGSLYTQKMAKKHNRPCLHIDLNKTTAFDAAVKINDWIYGYKIEVLNVAGPRASKDPKIYQGVKDILEVVINLGTIDVSLSHQSKAIISSPKTVPESVNILMSRLSLKDKTTVAKMIQNDLGYLHSSIGAFIRNEFGLWDGNDELMNDCCSISGEKELHPDDAAMVIIEELWKKLRETHTIRVVK
ncbi:YpsA SLOG family protein [Thermodesulfobacteriota bacterium]